MQSEYTGSYLRYFVGQCVLTLGTGQQSRRLYLLSGITLLPTHCYAVVGKSKLKLFFLVSVSFTLYIDVSESDDGHERRVTILTHNQATTTSASLEDQMGSLTLGGRNRKIGINNYYTTADWV